MAVKSSQYGGLRITGDSAQRFRNQVKYSNVSKTASASAKSGIMIAKSISSNGKYAFKVK